jgi:hypothetical protein
MLSVQAARMASASRLLFIKRPHSCIHSLSLADTATKVMMIKNMMPAMMVSSTKIVLIQSRTTGTKLIKGITGWCGGKSNYSFFSTQSADALDDDDDDDDDDDPYEVSTMTIKHQQAQPRAHYEVWMINLERDNSDQWLRGPRPEQEWYTGKAPTLHHCPGTRLQFYYFY